jgi:hypothetical protein
VSRTGNDDAATLSDLRRARRASRLGDIEWFDVLYQVYLFALGGLIAIVVASDSINGLVSDDLTTDELLARGPSIAGVVVAVAFAVGIRNGADGGPVSVESADVRHVLLSPVSRRLVLVRPLIQRIRSVAFIPALVVGALAQLVAREVEGSRAAWAMSGAAFGALVGVVYVSAATIAHAVAVPRWLASFIGTLTVGWQLAAAVTTWNRWDDPDAFAVVGPANLDGSLLFWGVRQRGVDLIAVGVVVAAVAVAIAVAGRLRLEPLERRGQLVSQLKFAATVQDIRTVVLLRRQLRAESVRSRPWVGVGARRRSTSSARPASRPHSSGRSVERAMIWRRGLVAMSRLPFSRLIRIAVLAAIAGASASLVVTSSFLFAVPFVGGLFLLGLEAIEPLAQEIDRPDLTDGLPVDRGWLFLNHLVAPAGLLAVAAMIGAAAATVVESSHALAAFALAVPVVWTGAIGPVVSTVRDAPAPADVEATTLTGRDRSSDSPFALPEFAGASNVMTGLTPIVFSAISLAPVAAMRADATVDTAIRSVIGVALCLAVMGWWIIRRDAWAIKVRSFFNEGRSSA